MGLVMNKAVRATDVHFTLDDGTGRIDVIRWQESLDIPLYCISLILLHYSHFLRLAGLTKLQMQMRPPLFSKHDNKLLY